MNKTRNLKKALSLVMILMMVVSTMVVMPLTANAADITVGGTCNGLTEGTAFQVGSLDDWKALKEQQANFYNTTCYVKLTADFAMSGSPVMMGNTYPSDANEGSVIWHFDGQGHTISNVIKPLFIGIASNSVIKNVNVEMISTATGKVSNDAYGGSIIGVVGGTAEALVENCTVSGNLYYGYWKGTARANGGIVASVINTASVTIKNCVNNAAVSGIIEGDPHGGIVGSMESTATLTIENCVNNGSVTTPGYAGGMLGYIKNAGTLVFKNCVNTGTIHSTGSRAGGLLGSINNSVSTTITNCRNEGDIIADVGQAGGAIGHAAKIVTITNFLNNGDITSLGTSVDHPPACAGGCVGSVNDGSLAADKVIMKNAINEGTISAVNTGNAAGLVGHAKRATIALTDCYDNGLVERNLFGTASTVDSEVTYTATLEDTYAMITPPEEITAENTSAAWNGTDVAAPALQDAEAANSAENPYIIDTPAKLAWFSAHNASFDLGTDGEGTAITTYYAKLTKNIDLGNKTWLGIKTAYVDANSATVKLNVNIDGDNYTIKNAKFSTTGEFRNGFFVGVAASSSGDTDTQVLGAVTVSNLHFNNIVQATYSNRNVGFLASRVDGSMTLTNVTIGSGCTIHVNRYNVYGHGVVGELRGTLTMDKCIAAGTMATPHTEDATGALGSFVGFANSGTLKITNSIGESSFGRNITGPNTIGAIVGKQNVTNYTFTNIFAASGLANAYAAGTGLSYTNCYTRSEANNPANAKAIETIKKMGVTTTIGAYEGVRLKLTDDFGFMPMYAITGGDAEAYNPFVSYGIKVGSEFVAGELYNGSTASFCVPYTGISVAKMSTDVTYTPVIMVNGVEVATGAEKTVNCYKIADALRADKGNGYYEGNLVTEDTYEIALYGAMADYCKAYSDYYANLPEEYK